LEERLPESPVYRADNPKRWVEDLADPAWKEDRFGSAAAGKNPTVIGKVTSGWVVLGDHQLLPGYCLLLSRHTQFADITDFPEALWDQFQRDGLAVGRTVQAVMRRRDRQLLRINYATLGNKLPVPHMHIQPRYGWEPEHNRKRTQWSYGDQVNNPEYALGERHWDLRNELILELGQQLARQRVPEAHRGHSEPRSPRL
jgi:diadenosine tetraphosphate (Ap4A) HIT family hydrolase